VSWINGFIAVSTFYTLDSTRIQMHKNRQRLLELPQL
jgi:hypothetical protein